MVLHTSGPTAKLSPLQVTESYIRGSDLVATFARIPPYEIAPQIYWRVREFPEFAAVGVEMILSMQTDLLYSIPRTTVSSWAPGATFFYTCSLANRPLHALEDQTFDRHNSSENLFLMRNHRLDLSYAELVHPPDFVSAEVFHDDHERPSFIQSTLFPERLEKGVIRRARICGWFLPAENDLATAVELAKRFVDEPPPLTT